MLDKTPKEKINWNVLGLGVVLLLVLDTVFLTVDLQFYPKDQYPEDFLVALLAMNFLIGIVAIILTFADKISLGKDGLSVQLGKIQNTQQKQEENLSNVITQMSSAHVQILATVKSLEEHKKIQQEHTEELKSVTTQQTAQTEKLESVTNQLKHIVNHHDLQLQKAAEEKNSESIQKSIKEARGILFDTNKAYDESAVWDMMENSKISAYGNLQYLIDGLNPEDIIFFYQSGKGIIAAGKVTEGNAIENPENDEKYCNVIFSTQVPNQEEGIINFLRPEEITQVTNRTFAYISTIKYPILDQAQSANLLKAVIERVGKPS